MSPRARRRLRAVAGLAFLPLASALAVPPKSHPAPAPANPTQSSAGGGGSLTDLASGQGPMEVTSDQSLELQQANKVYVARGNAVAKRGDRVLRADTLLAYWRELPHSDQTEIWRVIADGHVTITTPTQKVEGDHAVYDLDTRTIVLTGGGVRLTTPQDMLTARDSLEWHDDKEIAVARGDAVGIRGERRIRADTLVARVIGKPARISRVDASGHVLASAPDEIGSGDRGVYNVDTGVVTLTGHVTLVRGKNTLVGGTGVFDMKQGVSRLLPTPGKDGAPPGRVQGVIVPRDSSGAAAEPAAPPRQPSPPSSSGEIPASTGPTR